jgi:hypothetical protein
VWGHPYVVPHPGDALTGRRPKDYVVRLDHEGCCVVSEEVWARLQEARPFTPHPLVAVNAVEKGPKQIVGMGTEIGDDEPSWMRQERDFLREHAPPGTKVRVTRGRTLRR